MQPEPGTHGHGPLPGQLSLGSQPPRQRKQRQVIIINNNIKSKYSILTPVSVCTWKNLNVVKFASIDQRDTVFTLIYIFFQCCGS